VKSVDIFPFVRIALYLFSGWLAAQGANPDVVAFIKMDPQLAASITAAVTAVWWQIAKRKGWAT